MQNENAPIMISPGMFSDDRVISRIKPYHGGLVGWASLDGKRTKVATGHWGDAEIWQVFDTFALCHCDRSEGTRKASDGSRYCAKCGLEV